MRAVCTIVNGKLNKQIHWILKRNNMNNKNENRDKDKAINIIIFIIILLTTFIFIRGKIVDIKIKKNGIIDTAVVIDFGYSGKAGLNVKYEYNISNELKYTSSKCFYDGINNNLKIGDSIWVKYLPTNPQFNRLFVDKDNNFCKVSQKDCLEP